MARVLRIGVVGCGIGGLAAATLLARDGHDVTAFERAAMPGPVGAGLLIQPSGAAVLARLGVLDRVRGLAAPVNRLLALTTRGSAVLDLSYQDAHPRAVGLGTHRGALFGVLAACCADSRVTVQAGVDITGLEDQGRTLTDSTGTRRGPFDLVIIADGARSRLRRVATPWARERVYEWGAAWCVVEERPRAHADVLMQGLDGPRRMMGLLPTGAAHEGAAASVAVFWSLRTSEFESWRAGDVERWRREAVALMPGAGPIVEQVRSLSEFIPATYVDASASPCFRGRAVLLGDALHSMSPQLGQGANLALGDAASLADALRASDDVGSALRAYERQRRGTWSAYARMTRWLTPFFQSELPCVGPVRDCFLPLLCKTRWSRRQMLDSLIGMKRGLFHADALPEAALSAG